MAEIKPIRTEADYEKALSRIDTLMGSEYGSPEGDELDVLVTLVECWEDEHYPMGYPEPHEAVRFRMEQAGLRPRDLIPILGSRGRVSDVLSGKRAITMPMARALHEHLGIPADVLLRNPGTESFESPAHIDPLRYPVRRMAKLGWIKEGAESAYSAGEQIAEMIHRAGVDIAPAPYRVTGSQRVNAKTDSYALQAWCWRVMALANARSMPRDFVPGTVTLELLREVANLSNTENGPRLARDFLDDHGIVLEVVPHLPRTYLDGAALRAGDGRPVIGLTLRYDRIDRFWFGLLHELAHVGLHLDQGIGSFFADDFTLRESSRGRVEIYEKEADTWAEEALIPGEAWMTSTARTSPSALSVVSLASELRIHPAIVAGRVRDEQRNPRLLSQFTGNGAVRRQFEGVAWTGEERRR